MILALILLALVALVVAVLLVHREVVASIAACEASETHYKRMYEATNRRFDEHIRSPLHK